MRCASCRQPFLSPLQVDRDSLEAMVITVEHRCPRCGTVATYVKADHWYELTID